MAKIIGVAELWSCKACGLETTVRVKGNVEATFRRIAERERIRRMRSGFDQRSRSMMHLAVGVKLEYRSGEEHVFVVERHDANSDMWILHNLGTGVKSAWNLPSIEAKFKHHVFDGMWVSQGGNIWQLRHDAAAVQRLDPDARTVWGSSWWVYQDDGTRSGVATLEEIELSLARGTWIPVAAPATAAPAPASSATPTMHLEPGIRLVRKDDPAMRFVVEKPDEEMPGVWWLHRTSATGTPAGHFRWPSTSIALVMKYELFDGMLVKAVGATRVYRLRGDAACDLARSAWTVHDVFHKTEGQYARCIVEQYLRDGDWTPIVETAGQEVVAPRPAVQLRVGLRYYDRRSNHVDGGGTLWAIDQHSPSMPLPWSAHRVSDVNEGRASRQDWLEEQFAKGLFELVDATAQAEFDAADERERAERTARKDGQELEMLRSEMRRLRDATRELCSGDRGAYVDIAIHGLREGAKWRGRANEQEARANKLADKAGELETQRKNLLARVGELSEQVRELERKLARR